MEVQDLIGYITNDELAGLQSLSSQVSEGVIVNIGTFQGKSAVAMALSSSVDVYTIDKFKYNKVDEYLDTFGLSDRVHQIIKRSQDIKDWTEPIGLLFIDGEHFYEEVMQDYLSFSPHLVKGGFLCFHDYNQTEPKWRLEVSKVLDDLPEIFEKYEIVLEVEYLLCLKQK